MGAVYKAEDTRLGRLVAVKVMLPNLAGDADARARFLREARAVAALQHNHVVPIYQVGQAWGGAFFVMPLLQGESLERRLEREPRLPLAEVLRIAREAAEGLHSLPMPPGSFTATSSQPTCGWRPARLLDVQNTSRAASRCLTSVWPGQWTRATG